MTSPFSNYQAFSEAKGPIYTFANNPTMIAFLLLISLAIAVYFFYASFNLRQDESKAKNPAVLSILLLASAASLVTSLLQPAADKQPTVSDRRSSTQVAQSKTWQPFAMLGMVGGIGTAIGRKKSRRSKPRRLR